MLLDRRIMPDNSRPPADASSPDLHDFHPRPSAQEQTWSPAQDLGTSAPVGDSRMAAGEDDDDLDDEDDEDEESDGDDADEDADEDDDADGDEDDFDEDDEDAEEDADAEDDDA